MDVQDVNAIITEISNLKNLGIALSESLDTERIMSGFEQIDNQLKHGRYVLLKMYSLIKRIQKSINTSLHSNDINAFIQLVSIVEAIRKKLGKQYEIVSAVTCPGNILSDISMLEVLVGGKRAGNNSVEIINEAADICRRLFAGGVMGIDVYRELINELTENHRDAHGYDENPMDFSD